MKTKFYILSLIKEGHRWQYTNLKGEEIKPRVYFSPAQWIIIFISVLLVYNLPNGLNNEFINFTITAFSIFIGLFLALIISIYDKFQKVDFSLKYNEIEKINLIETKNFFKQFTSLTSYTILI